MTSRDNRAAMSNHAVKLLHEAHLRFQRQQQADGAVDAAMRKQARFVKAPPSTLLIWSSMSDAYRAMFCEHGKAMWSPCGSCRRDNRAARQNFAKLVAARLSTVTAKAKL